jgi:hypothetical protein
MESAAFVGDWDKFGSFLADDVYFRVGNTAEVRGPKAVVDFMVEMFASRLALNDLHVRGSWETEDAVIMEFDLKAFRHRDNKNVAFPCLDIYRFGSNNKITDWRVFAIEPTHIV